MHDAIAKQLVAVFKGTTVGGALNTTFARGCSGAYVGPGVVTITLDPAPYPHPEVPAAERLTDIQLHTAGLSASTADTSPTVSTTAIVDAAGMAAEGAFEVKIYRVITR